MGDVGYCQQIVDGNRLQTHMSARFGITVMTNQSTYNLSDTLLKFLLVFAIPAAYGQPHSK